MDRLYNFIDRRDLIVWIKWEIGGWEGCLGYFGGIVKFIKVLGNVRGEIVRYRDLKILYYWFWRLWKEL